MPKAVFLVFTNCDAGREAEFNHWYDTIHLPDLLAVAGIVGAQRFQLAGAGPQTVTATSAPAVAQYLAVYDLDTEDVAAVLQRIQAIAPDWQAQGRLFDGFQVVSGASYVALGARQTAPAPTTTTTSA